MKNVVPSSSPSPEGQKPKTLLQKLSTLPAAARGAVLAALMGCTNGNGVHEKNADGPQQQEPHGAQVDKEHGNGKEANGHHEKAELPPEVMAAVLENKDALLQIQKEGVQSYFDKLQKEQPIVVPEQAVVDVCLCCIDERQRKGKSHGVAGAGILLKNEQLEVLVRNALATAGKKTQGPGQPVTIRVQPHLGGACGAAALNRKLRGEKDMSKNAINDEAMTGAKRTAGLIEERAKDLGVKVNVVVEPFPESEFLADPNHPAGIAMVNHLPNTVVNKDAPPAGKKTTARPMMFHASAVLAGTDVAEKDAVLAAVIAHLSHHGFREDAQELPKTIPFRIVNAVATKEEGDRRKAEVETMLSGHKDLAEHFRRGDVVVDTWIAPTEKR